jgi:malate dehydrogenase (oxaloacetate-decarboxylating)(NADP+)
MIRKNDALEYHSRDRRGKIEVKPSKPCLTQWDLSLAYTPGVAYPCKEIEANPEDAYRYTTKGNLVAVISNGTAVLGLGDIGALAGKPVMEGKGVLFKRFADIDVFDIELDTHDPEEIIRTCQLLEPTFGGINLEDIKAPECFHIEETLKKTMSIPVFHDDQHGTAIISGAGLLNALDLVGKDISKVKVVFNGAGAAGIACAEFYILLGVKRENVVLCDSTGTIYKGREKGMNPYKERFAGNTKARTLAEAMVGADVFCGVSVADCVTKEMIRSMAKDPIVFAMANPDPEITYNDATAARDDIIMATGRSDFPNQVNNVLGFPFIFRGALDVRARAINNEMKLAAAHALAKLAREDVPDSVRRAYGGVELHFGREYIIPKPFDPRILLWEAPAVAEAAMRTGVARQTIDLEEYKLQLEARFGKAQQTMRGIIAKAQKDPKRVVFPEGDHERILRAVQIILDEKIARPILLGDPDVIHARTEALRLDLTGAEIIEPRVSPMREKYAHALFELRQRKGITMAEADRHMVRRNYYGTMMVQMGDADALIAGISQHYPDTLRPALQIIGTRPGVSKVSGMYMMVANDDIYFFADTTVKIQPTVEELAETAIACAEEAQRFGIAPRVAMLSFSNFGSAPHPLQDKMRLATELVRERAPWLEVDGEMQADTAVLPKMIKELYPFCRLTGRANVLIFPNLEAGNIAMKLVQHLGGAEAIGPIVVGMRKPVHVLHYGGTEVNEIVNMAALAVVDAQWDEATAGAAGPVEKQSAPAKPQPAVKEWR